MQNNVSQRHGHFEKWMYVYSNIYLKNLLVTSTNIPCPPASSLHLPLLSVDANLMPFIFFMVFHHWGHIHKNISSICMQCIKCDKKLSCKVCNSVSMVIVIRITLYMCPTTDVSTLSIPEQVLWYKCMWVLSGHICAN